MIRKPKMHFGISTKGTTFRERWNIVEMATESEFKEYILLEGKANSIPPRDPNTNRWNSSGHAQKEDIRVKQRYMRKCWRLRYGNQFKEDQLYRIDKIIHRYNCKVSPRGANGVMGLWTITRLGANLKGLIIDAIITVSYTHLTLPTKRIV